MAASKQTTPETSENPTSNTVKIEVTPDDLALIVETVDLARAGLSSKLNSIIEENRGFKRRKAYQAAIDTSACLIALEERLSAAQADIPEVGEIARAHALLEQNPTPES